MNAILAITAVCLLPSEGLVQDRCDVIEVNHYHGEDGRLIHTQVIFWDYDEYSAGENVAAWRLWKNPSRMPTRNQHTGDWEVLFHDTDAGTMRMVAAKNFRQTWTQYDREMNARGELPPSKRRGLTQRREELSSGR